MNSHTIRTAKGLIINLIAIKPIGINAAANNRKTLVLVGRGHKLLVKLTQNKLVTLVFDDHEPDRYGRRAAHVFVSKGKNNTNTWVQAEMVKRGLARVFPNSLQGTCIQRLLGIEKEARNKKAGLWKNRNYQVIQANNLKVLNDRVGQLQVIEGTVQSIAVHRSISYVNFSKNWKRDFTVTISRRVHRLFTQSGVNIKEWAGKNIRVRGWLDRHNGPTINLYHVAQIEVLNQ